jgi:hypothetical protein
MWDLTIDIKVSIKSTPGCCEKPVATILAYALEYCHPQSI